MTAPDPRPTDIDPSEVEPRSDPPAGSTAEHPLGEDRRFFLPGQPGSLRDQMDLDDGDADVREYTGEPVETDEGWVIPQQQNVGPGNQAGGGEWPDPTTRPASAPADEPQLPAAPSPEAGQRETR
jgi:hypothetical protein